MYQNFEDSKYKASVESVDESVRDEATDEREQESRAHEVGEGSGCTGEIEVHH